MVVENRFTGLVDFCNTKEFILEKYCVIFVRKLWMVVKTTYVLCEWTGNATFISRVTVTSRPTSIFLLNAKGVFTPTVHTLCMYSGCKHQWLNLVPTSAFWGAVEILRLRLPTHILIRVLSVKVKYSSYTTYCNVTLKTSGRLVKKLSYDSHTAVAVRIKVCWCFCGVKQN